MDRSVLVGTPPRLVALACWRDDGGETSSAGNGGGAEGCPFSPPFSWPGICLLLEERPLGVGEPGCKGADPPRSTPGLRGLCGALFQQYSIRNAK